MSEHVTCECGRNWSPVPSILKAHNGHRSQPRLVTVPDEDVYGNVHGTVQRPSSHWVAEGPSVPLEHSQTATQTLYTWTCACGHALVLAKPRFYLVTCQHGVRPGMAATMCGVAAIRKNPPSDLYVNARYGGACPCCGHQGTHWVQHDQAAPCGARPVLAPTAP